MAENPSVAAGRISSRRKLLRQSSTLEMHLPFAASARLQQALPAFAVNFNFAFRILLLMAATHLFTIARAADRTQARSMVISRYGIVATEHPLASQIGATILAQGGNAVDAAVAANAAMGVVAPMANGIGGDLFALVYEAKSGKLYGLNASGWNPN